jgi:hypothetical protein
LKRKFGLEMRYATLPELMFLDLSYRLATGNSPMEIGSFRCEHPKSNHLCLRYGHIDQNGAQIEVEDKPDEWEEEVLPLLIVPVEKNPENNQ